MTPPTFRNLLGYNLWVLGDQDHPPFRLRGSAYDPRLVRCSSLYSAAHPTLPLYTRTYGPQRIQRWEKNTIQLPDASSGVLLVVPEETCWAHPTRTDLVHPSRVHIETRTLYEDREQITYFVCDSLIVHPSWEVPA